MRRWLMVAALVAGCRSSDAPRRAPELPRVDCDRLLRETEIQGVCGAEIASRTAGLGEGGTETVCDRKFRAADGRQVAFAVRHGAPAAQRSDYAARAAAAGKLPELRALLGLGEAALRFSEPTPEGERRTLEVLRGPWRIVLYSGRRTVRGVAVEPLCTLDALELLGKLLVRRLR